MCVPAAIGAAIIAGATSAVQIISQNKAATATNKALQAANVERKKQIDQATTAEINNRLREMRREQSRIQVAAGEAGLSLSSGSIETLLMDSAMQAELSNKTSLANRESRRAASDAETASKFISTPSTLTAGLMIGLSAASAKMNASRKSGS
ncbi:virion core protein, T7 gp14 family [Novosphingobium meiothermophilum]|uniref:virion core protein, T7 gp14 family n=1 Tax=Novosphingobium meiothermophilum TaxID=2202251 RepID=UPI000D6DEA7A|nr:hypothetical protein [Novosphingobium meiothermophilum]